MELVLKTLQIFTGSGYAAMTWGNVVMLLVGAGLRREELTGVQCADLIDLPARNGKTRWVLQVKGKGAKDRVIPISAVLAVRLVPVAPFVVEGIANMLKLTATQKNVVLSTKVEEGLVAYADEGLVFQVVMNLINNAIKFTRPGGRVQIEACGEDAGTVIVTINDNGIGIPEEALGKLFRYEKLYSTRGTEGELGTGLGLSICKRIIDLHHGTIAVRSEVNKGTSISFTLPTEDIFQIPQAS